MICDGLQNHFLMKLVLAAFFWSFFLVSCTTASAELAASTSTVIFPSPVPPTFTATPTQLIPISTPQVTVTTIPCDPQIEDFCITDGHFVFQRPIRPPANDIVDSSYPYGSTARGTRDPHHGVEFLNKFGTPVYAAGDGVVIFAGTDEETIYSPWINFYGNLVVIEHGDGLFTLYAHLSKIEVEARENIRAGDKIGEVGQSGVATGSHLHFEVRKGEVEDYFSTVNPELWLVQTKDEHGAVAISIVDESAEFRFTEMTVNFYLDRSQLPVKSYYVTTYSRDLSTGEENAAIGDLTPGSYRFALTMNGQVYQRWVEVESGKLTQVVFVVK